MATASFVIRCKTENGNFVISDLSGSSSVKKLKEAIRDVTNIDPERMKILHGYPPKPVMCENDNAKLDDVNIRSGDTLIISVGKAQNEGIPESEIIPLQKPKSMPVQKPKSMPAQKPKSMPAQKPKSMPAQKPKSMPAQKPKSMPVMKPGPMPVQNPGSVPVMKPGSVPVQNPGSVPVQNPGSASVQNPGSVPVQSPSSMPAVNFNYGDVLSDQNGIMMRHEVPANNSCLFNSVYFILQKEVDCIKSNELRYVIAKAVRKDTAKFNEAFLGRSNREYSDWILNPDHWGGAIELSILSDYFRIEICAIDVINCTMHRFGENNFHAKRAFLIYDGIHYDPLVMHMENEKKTLFPVTDNRVLEMAMEIAKEAQSSRQFTDTQNFDVKCNVCGLPMHGDKEATAHALATGHCNFGEF